MTNASLELTVRTTNALREFVQARREALRNADGQTAAEYLGIIVVVGVIIFALVQGGFGDTIKKAIEGAINDIAGGKNPTAK